MSETEWDLTEASEADLVRLAEWIDLHKRFRPLLHSGRMVRPESGDLTVLLHGVVAADASEALVAHVQVDEPAHNRGSWLRVPRLDHASSYDLRWTDQFDPAAVSKSAALAKIGPTEGR